MIRLQKIRDQYIEDGIDFLNASARTCQDVFLMMIAASPFSSRVTIKGGVVMQHLSGDIRRATQDIDLDFIKYSLHDDQLLAFIDKLNQSDAGITLSVTGPIVPLKHPDYQGKRMHVQLIDQENTTIEAKLDIGVHRHMDMQLESFCFDLFKLDNSVTLLINSKEQMITEKLKSLLRLGTFSTRYKDFFDICYLIINEQIHRERLDSIANTLIFSDSSMREGSWEDISRRLHQILSNQRFVEQLRRSDKNWLDISLEEAVHTLLSYFNPSFY